MSSYGSVSRQTWWKIITNCYPTFSRTFWRKPCKFTLEKILLLPVKSIEKIKYRKFISRNLLKSPGLNQRWCFYEFTLYNFFLIFCFEPLFEMRQIIKLNGLVIICFMLCLAIEHKKMDLNSERCVYLFWKWSNNRFISTPLRRSELKNCHVFWRAKWLTIMISHVLKG